MIELGIAAFGAFSAPFLRYTSEILDPLYGLIDGQFTLFLVMQFVVSFFSLAIPTFLMGASLPILITALAQNDTFRQRVALLYGINTLGAALARLQRVFSLPALGIVNTLWIAAGAGVLVAIGAFALDRESPPKQEAVTPAVEVDPAVPLPHLLLWTIGLAGSLGVGYQIAWTRLLVPVVGSSVYAFTIILTTVLLGIGAGALLAALPQLRNLSYHRAVAAAMGIGACSSVAGLFAVNRLPDIFSALAHWGGETTWLLFLCQGLLTAWRLIVCLPVLSVQLASGVLQAGVVPLDRQDGQLEDVRCKHAGGYCRLASCGICSTANDWCNSIGNRRCVTGGCGFCRFAPDAAARTDVKAVATRRHACCALCHLRYDRT